MINVSVSMRTSTKSKRKRTSKDRFTVSLLDEKVRKFANDKAERDYDDNLSLYVRTLIRRDMNGAAA